MTAQELREKYLKFFEKRGHTAIPSASLVPVNDPTVLFTTAGMHPLVPFLLGEKHPAGNRLVNYQRCIRTGDIDLVGDDTHLTFFEMLGNWSLGDYFKKEAIAWSYEFLTSKKEGLGLDPDRIYISCFAGEGNVPKDEESAQLWEKVGIPKDRIAFLGMKDNFWGPAGQTGPCGPDTEMFYQVNMEEDEQPEGAHWPKGKYVEIWNDVFMEYNKTADGIYEALKQKNVDTGMGVERTVAIVNGLKSVYETEVFAPLLAMIREKADKYNERSARIIVDHVKASVLLILDGVMPSKKEWGYVLRKLIREALRNLTVIAAEENLISMLTKKIVDIYSPVYGSRWGSEQSIKILEAELKKYEKLKKAKKRVYDEVIPIIKASSQPLSVSAIKAFDLRQTYGVHPDTTFEILSKEKVLQPEDKGTFDLGVKREEKKHQDLSRKGAEQKFKGGLADHSAEVIRLHTATHLLHQALKDVLGDHVAQKGSNITKERLRFDFTHPSKMTKEEIKKVEDIVNEKVQEAIPVERKVMPIDEARKLGATGLFGEKYGDTVSVYIIGDYSKEFCGGPHVTNTKEVGAFRITKEEAVSAGVRRIKATVS